MNADEDEAQFMMNSAPIQELIKLTGLNQKGRKKGKGGRSTGKRKRYLIRTQKGVFISRFSSMVMVWVGMFLFFFLFWGRLAFGPTF